MIIQNSKLPYAYFFGAIGIIGLFTVIVSGLLQQARNDEALRVTSAYVEMAYRWERFNTIQEPTRYQSIYEFTPGYLADVDSVDCSLIDGVRIYDDRVTAPASVFLDVTTGAKANMVFYQTKTFRIGYPYWSTMLGQYDFWVIYTGPKLPIDQYLDPKLPSQYRELESISDDAQNSYRAFEEFLDGRSVEVEQFECKSVNLMRVQI